METESIVPQRQFRCLSETDERNLDYQILTPGYIRNVIKLNVENLPEAIIDLCQTFVVPEIFQNERDDPANSISNRDKEISDQYKAEGNQCFKSKHYAAAIAKYTTALRFNPNNHLLYCNRAYCYYLSSNYTDALSDAEQSINIRTTFCKGWFRYGCILQKQQKYDRAGVAYQTAYNLSINWKHNEQSDVNNPYRLHYTNFMKLLQDDDRLEELNYINNFGENLGGHWKDTVDLIAQKFPELEQLMTMRDNGEMNAELLFKFQEMMENETEIIEQKENDDFRALVEQSKCYYLAQQKVFNFAIEDGDNEVWQISWSSTPQIDCHKRIICVNICSKSGVIVNNWLQHGVPNANQFIYTLLRAMTYCNLTKTKCIKPRGLIVGYRMKNDFEAIEIEMNTFGICCVLQTKEQNVKACGDNETNIDGWNHL